MQKGGILNSHIAKVLADLGHTDTICICDCGLPVPEGVLKIDLAIEPGKPGFLHILELMLGHMRVEKAYVAEELDEHNPYVSTETNKLLEQFHIPVEAIMHEGLKNLTKNCKCVIRTGECSPYANIILQADCIFAPEK